MRKQVGWVIFHVSDGFVKEGEVSFWRSGGGRFGHDGENREGRFFYVL